MARRALTPPLVVAVAGITPLLPGLALYRGLYAMLRNEMSIGMTALFAAFGIGCALAAGVTLGEWLARRTRNPRSIFKVGSLRRPQLRRIPRIRLEKKRPVRPAPTPVTGPIPITDSMPAIDAVATETTRATLRLGWRGRDSRRM